MLPYQKIAGMAMLQYDAFREKGFGRVQSTVLLAALIPQLVDEARYDYSKH